MTRTYTIYDNDDPVKEKIATIEARSMVDAFDKAEPIIIQQGRYLAEKWGRTNHVQIAIAEGTEPSLTVDDDYEADVVSINPGGNCLGSGNPHEWDDIDGDKNHLYCIHCMSTAKNNDCYKNPCLERQNPTFAIHHRNGNRCECCMKEGYNWGYDQEAQPRYVCDDHYPAEG